MNLNTAYTELVENSNLNGFIEALTKECRNSYDAIPYCNRNGNLWRDDVAQETVLSCLQYIDTLKGLEHYNLFHKYVNSVFYRTATRFIHDDGMTDIENVDLPSVEDNSHTLALVSNISEYIDSMKEPTKQIVLARLLTNRSFESLSKDLGISSESVRKLHSRALAVLKEEI